MKEIKYLSNKIDSVEKTNKEICKLLKVTMPTLLSALKIVRIELKGSGNRMSKSIIIIK